MINTLIIAIVITVLLIFWIAASVFLKPLKSPDFLGASSFEEKSFFKGVRGLQLLSGVSLIMIVWLSYFNSSDFNELLGNLVIYIILVLMVAISASVALNFLKSRKKEI